MTLIVDVYVYIATDRSRIALTNAVCRTYSLASLNIIDRDAFVHCGREGIQAEAKRKPKRQEKPGELTQ